MFKTSAQLKDFIIWCQENKVKIFKNNDIEFELSELAFLPENENYEEIKLTDENTFSDTDGMTEEEKDELLYWSTGKTPSKG